MSASNSTSDSEKSVYKGRSDGFPLPTEVVIQIFENFCMHCASKPSHERANYLTDNHDTVKLRWNLINLSLTCRRFRALAQPILFHYLPRTRHWYEGDFYNPSFYGSVKHENLFELVRTLVWKKKFRRHLRVIAIDNGYRTMNRWCKLISHEDRLRFNKVAVKLGLAPCWWDEEDWFRVPPDARASKYQTVFATRLTIRMAHNLEVLELARMMDPDHFREIAAPLKPLLRLTRLRIGWSLHPYSIERQAFTDVRWFLALAPKLNCLELTHLATIDLMSEPWERAMPFDCLDRLRRLDLYQAHLNSNDLVQILTSVPNLDTLIWYSKLPWKDLDVNVGGRFIWSIPLVRNKNMITPPQLVDVLVAAAPQSLRTLMVSMPNLNSTALGFSAKLSTLTQLEYLIVGRGVICNRDDTPPLVSLLPPSLKRFDITHLLLLWNTPKLLRMLIQLSKALQKPSEDQPGQRKHLPNLKVIRCHIRFVKAELSPTDDTRWAQYLCLKDGLAALGIDFLEGAEPLS